MRRGTEGTPQRYRLPIRVVVERTGWQLRAIPLRRQAQPGCRSRTNHDIVSLPGATFVMAIEI